MTENSSSIPRFMVCPYCGSMHKDHLPEVCEHCHGRLDPESREQTRADLGPWFVRSVDRPFSPGMRYETLVRQVGLGRIQSTHVVRGPTTSQFWTVARKVPGLSHHFGLCHACQAPASPEDEVCQACNASFRVTLDRDRMGLGSDDVQASAFMESSSPEAGSDQPHVAPPASPSLGEASGPGTSNQLRRELLAARRRQNALHWLVGALVLGVLALLVLQELKSPVPVASASSSPLPEPAPSSVIPATPVDAVPKIKPEPIAPPASTGTEDPSPIGDAVLPEEGKMSLEEALLLYQRAVDTSRSPLTRQAELGGLEVELVSLVDAASPERSAQWQTLSSLVRQAIMDLQAELRLAPEASRATSPNSP